MKLSDRSTLWKYVTRNENDTLPLLIGVVAVGAALRLYGLGAEAYWLDEIFSIQSANPDSLLQDSFHPPLYYTVLYLWTSLFGRGEVAVRLLSAMFSIGTLGVIFGIGRQLYDDRVGVISMFLLAVSLSNVQFAQMARMYSMAVFFAAASSYFCYGLLWEDRQTYRNAVLYGLTSLLLVYTHYTGFYVLFAQFLYVVSVFERIGVSRFKKWLAVQAVLGILCVPLFLLLAKALLTDLHGVDLTDVPVSFDIIVGTLRNFTGSSIQLYVYGSAVCIALFDGSSIVTLSKSDNIRAKWSENPLQILNVRKQNALLLFWLGTPFVISFVLAKLTTVGFQPRYVLVSTVPLFILVAKGIRDVDRQWVIAAFIVGVLVLSAPAFGQYYTTTQNEEWREAASYVEQQTEPGDLLLFNAGGGGVRGAFTFYFDGDDRVQKPFPNESREVTEQRLGRLSNVTAGYNRVVVVLSHSRDCKGQIARQLEREYNLTNRGVFHNIDVYVFSRTEPQRVPIPDRPDRGALIAC